MKPLKYTSAAQARLRAGFATRKSKGDGRKMLVSTKIAAMFREPGFVNIDYLKENKLDIPASKILNILNRDWRKWVKPLCMQPSLKSISDPTFGYTTIGSTYTSSLKDWYRGSKYALAEAGTADSISVYIRASSGTITVDSAIYNTSFARQGDILSLSGVDTTPAWRTLNYVTHPSLAAADYWLIAGSTVGGYLFNRDDGETNQGVAENSYGLTNFCLYEKYYGTWKFSIYCTYTSAAPPPAARRVLMDGLTVF
jgi:hypothetical protein